MSESHSVLSNILKRGRLTSPGSSARHPSFKDSCSHSIFHDSGYNESLKDPSFDNTDAEHKGVQSERGLHEYSKYSHFNLSTSVLSPIECENAIFLSGRKEASVHTDLSETPKVVKKDLSLRRRLLVSKSASVGAVSERQASSSGTGHKKTSISHFLSFDERVSKCCLDSPRKKSYKPLATSTLKSEDPASGCQKLRLAFSQQRTSTLDDSKSNGSLLSEPGCLSPIQPKSANTSSGLVDSALTCFNYQSTCSELEGTPYCTLSETNDDRFVTPIHSLVEDLNIVEISTPLAKEISNLSLLTPDSSSYDSFDLEKLEESSNQEGSFQELHQKCNESSNILNSKRKVRKLQRSRRLSTLSEHGSQSEQDEDCESILARSKCKLNIAVGSIKDSELVFNEDDDKLMIPNAGDLSRTPALQVIHELFAQSRSKRTKQSDLLRNIDGAGMSVLKCIVAQLIGKKMGLEKLDILTELRDRDLKHVLAMILDILTVESLCSMWKVSKNWQQIVIQDKHANRRRKLYIKQLRAEAKVAKTLFTDEALKPCPRCQCPAKYQPIKKRGLCSRENCAFDFCVLCLCAFHGSKDCSSSTDKWQNRKEALPGSAKSKRNLKRL
ncbi:F-box only protein 43 isoform X2 [Hemicordylus capensis]|uniref:F-box only protein 43 isoform X2 n=1 Tax=Hemicordylus capensis TaxID=884348 RepID=UPI002303200D|nr:F-box only protein 43 isoform X2 [Hemicordylus capensis]